MSDSFYYPGDPCFCADCTAGLIAEVAQDEPVCVFCNHYVDEHGPAGCEHEWDGLVHDYCNCSEHPPPYDPSAP